MSEITFKSYNSLDNATQSLINNAIMFNNVLWCAREKLHGTNYQMSYDGTTFRSGSRNDFLEPLSNFYNNQDIDIRYKHKVIQMYEDSSMLLNDLVLVIYGEYAGTLKTGKKIQKQIDYGDSDFYVFDIGIRNKIMNEDEKIEYLDDTTMQSLCDKFGFKTAPLLKIGLPSEIFSLPTSFKSVVNDMNNNIKYSVVESENDDDNIAEGYVAKPLLPAYKPNGKRVIFKCKNAKFLEKDTKTEIIIKTLSESDSNFVNEYMSYITDNRLRNVLSKTGVPKPSDFPKIAELLYTDACDDFSKENTHIDTVYMNLDDCGTCINTIKHSINAFIRPKWKSIFEGEF